MIEGTQIIARQIETVNKAGIEVRYIKLIMSGIEGDIAKAGSAIGHAGEFEIGKQRDLTRCSINAPD